MVTSFLRHMKAENKSANTITAYRYAADGLAAFLADRGMPTRADAIKREHVEAYVQDLLDHRSPATANQRYRSTFQFFKWLREEGEITEPPMIHMSPPSIPERPVPVVSDADLRGLLASCDRKTFDGRRDEAILRVFIDAGIRLGEMAGIRLVTEDGSDVDLDDGVLRVTGKGRRTRLVGMGPKSVQSLDRYLRLRVQHRHSALPWLWIGTKGRTTESGIRRMVWRRSEDVGIGRVHPHQLRHSFAHRWLAAGGSELDMQRLAEWKSPAMLRRYAASTGEREPLMPTSASGRRKNSKQRLQTTSTADPVGPQSHWQGVLANVRPRVTPPRTPARTKAAGGAVSGIRPCGAPWTSLGVLLTLPGKPRITPVCFLAGGGPRRRKPRAATRHPWDTG
jgi:site-specific recombinase XerD